MPVQWPNGLFPAAALDWRPAFSVSGGPDPLSGPPQEGDLGVGYWWTCTPSGQVLRTRRNQLNAWYGVLQRLLMIDPVIIVPWIAQPLAPWPAGLRTGLPLVPFSDGATFSDGGEWATDVLDFVLAEDLAMNATSAVIERRTGGDPIGGEPFTLVGASGLPFVHQVGSVESLGADHFRIGFGPWAREACDEGAKADFEHPRCAMTLPLADIASAFPSISPGYRGRPGPMTFVEYQL